jgi:putative membrane protein
MKKPIARPTKQKTKQKHPARTPRIFERETSSSIIESFAEHSTTEDATQAAPRRKGSRMWRLLLATGALLLSLALGLAAEQLIRDLFARFEWLGWLGVGVLALLLIALITLVAQEIRALLRLRQLDALRDRAATVLRDDNRRRGQQLVSDLGTLYARRPDMARPRSELSAETAAMLDGADMVRTAERKLMTSLDDRARTLTAASARRVAIVTAISPRALIDIAFVAYESLKLARAIAELYGARPGLLGSWRLGGAILGHLAVTGGVALGDSLIQQMVGHGLAAKLSARLGEGLVNGLMTVRVGIAAIRVTRPLPFDALKQPLVMDFMADLAKLSANDQKT